MKTTVNITPKGIAIETDDMVINIESKKDNKPLVVYSPEEFISESKRNMLAKFIEEENAKRKIDARSGKSMEPDCPRTKQKEEYDAIIKTVAKPKKEKKPLNNFQVPQTKVCATCKKEFFTTAPRQKYCSEACGLKPKPEKQKITQQLKKKTLTPEEEAELEKTLAEINQRQHQPYQIS